MSEQITCKVKGPFWEGDELEVRTLVGPKGSNLLGLLKENGLYQVDCGGLGSCGKCKLRFEEGAPIPTAADREHIEPKLLRQGYRLACRHGLSEGMSFELAMPVMSIPKVVEYYEKEENQKDTACEEAYIAIDLGTTTVAMQLICGGKVCASYQAINPQRVYGADVISRIKASMDGNAKALSGLIRDCLEQGIRGLLQNAEGVKASFAVLAGNTTMIHLLMEYPVDGLGRYPFRPVDITPQDIVLAGIPAYIIPWISAFVGGDILAGMYANGLHKTDDLQILLDLGTNGEIVLGKSGKYYATSTAAGPAFEVNTRSGRMGADLIYETAKLLEEGIVDSEGTLCEEFFETGVYRNGSFFRKEDVRELQKAKAAIAAGIHILLKEYGASPSEVTEVFLAGGFGYYLDEQSALRIGLCSLEFEGRIRAVGNASLEGAVRIGQKICEERSLDKAKEQEKAPGRPKIMKMLEQIKQECTVINLAQYEGFEKAYIERLNLEPF